VGAAGLVVVTAVLYWLLTDEAFTVTDERVSFRGLVHADEARVRERLPDLERGPNVFRVRASELVSELSTLTEVDAASARVTLPADVSITLDERDPVFIWSDGDNDWLVDEEGMLFAPADTVLEPAAGGEPGAETTAADTEPAADTTAADTARADAREGLPIIRDDRLPEVPPTVGSYLPATDLAAMRQLLAIDAELLGPRATELEWSVNDRDGYVLDSVDGVWRALFGRYTLTLQPPEVIPRQVQCLRSLLASDTRRLQRIYLVVTEGGCGTYTTYGKGSGGDG
jgi:hypothetical protein